MDSGVSVIWGDEGTDTTISGAVHGKALEEHASFLAPRNMTLVICNSQNPRIMSPDSFCFPLFVYVVCTGCLTYSNSFLQ